MHGTRTSGPNMHCQSSKFDASGPTAVATLLFNMFNNFIERFHAIVDLQV
jgi:hypothetical protein